MNCNLSLYASLPVISLDMSLFSGSFCWLSFFNLFKFFYAERKQIKEELEDQYQSILDKNAQEMEDMKKTFEEKLKEAEQKGVISIAYIW